MTFAGSIRALLGVSAAALLIGTTPAFADDTALKGEIDQLQQQIQLMQKQLQSLQNQVNAQPAPVAAAAPPSGPRVTESAAHRFGLSSADGQNTIELNGKLNVDVGDYLHYGPNSADVAGGKEASRLASGVNVRRARIGVDGKFMGDWSYALIYDFGGTSDSLNFNNAGANGNSKSAPSTSNTALSGVENAFITYNGFYNHGQQFPVAFDFGVIDVPWTLDEPTGADNIMFMERSSAQVVATLFGGGDSRTAFGVRSNNDRYWAGAYVTGPNTGALHDDGNACTDAFGAIPTEACLSGSTTAPSGNMVQLAAVARGSYQIIQTEDASLHFGIDLSDTFHPETGANVSGISLSDRPELRIDPTTFLTTSTIPASSAYVYSAEAAAAWGNAFAQGEFYHYVVDQSTVDAPQLNFNGGYVEASYSFGGKRRYNPATGAYTGVIPESPLSWSGGGWGAIELAARYSMIDLDDQLDNTHGIGGGRQTVWSLGVNYYPNLNMRFMFDLEHADISVPSGPTVIAAVKGLPASIDAIAARTQINF
jgi:phosphate-selective porin OprO and OprP